MQKVPQSKWCEADTTALDLFLKLVHFQLANRKKWNLAYFLQSIILIIKFIIAKTTKKVKKYWKSFSQNLKTWYNQVEDLC